MRHFKRIPTMFVLFLLLRIPASAQTIYAENQIAAQGVAIEYAVTIRNPVSHLYDVEMGIHGMRTTTVDVAMPAWEPGAYAIQNFAKNVQDFRATSNRGQALQWQQTDKQTWHITKASADDVAVHYQVYSNRLTD